MSHDKCNTFNLKQPREDKRKLMHVISEVLLLKRDAYLFQAKKGQQMIKKTLLTI